MDIYAKPGTKVVFDGCGGWPGEADEAKKHLQIGQTYTVEFVWINQYSSAVYLEECPNRPFNTSLFSDLPC